MTPTVRQTREGAGFSIEEAAQRVGCSAKYLRRIEAGGTVSWPLAQRLARLYRASEKIFLTKRAGRHTPKVTQVRQDQSPRTGRGGKWRMTKKEVPHAR
jgi:transcriptional regulator with XRE-family HTH domain